MQGAILLELYTRDGITGVCMIAADLYEGIRPAQLGDQAEVRGSVGRRGQAPCERGRQLPLASAGAHIPRSPGLGHLPACWVEERRRLAGLQIPAPPAACLLS